MSALIGPEIHAANDPAPGPFEDDPERHELALRMVRSPARATIVEYLRHAQLLGFDALDPDIMRRAIRAGEAERPEVIAATQLPPEATCKATQPLVYYMAIGQMVKIGTSANLLQRIDQIGPMDVLAVEAGGVAVERERHRQFAHLRCHREWFHFRDHLPPYVAQLRVRFKETYGEPIDDWLDRLWPARRAQIRWPCDATTGAPLFGV